MSISCIKIEYPDAVKEVIGVLTRAGHEAYAVGGCIRDSLMGHKPDDWDITTSATPDEMLSAFESAGMHTYKTGLKHGTITVLCRGEGFECTTYRTESGYSDGRHPDSVSFSKKLSDDLCRRDFTINAMAASPALDLIDLYGGKADIEAKILRCVGEPSVRFGEDALRILRAVRFATVLGFRIDPPTAAAIVEKRDMLTCVSAERKSVEFCKTLLSDDPDRGLDMLYGFGLMDFILPGVKRTKKRLSSLPKNLPLRLAASLFESPDVSLSPLRLSNAVSSSVKRLLVPPPNINDREIFARTLMHEYGEFAPDACLLYELYDLPPIISKEKDNHACVKVADLALGGEDLKSLGYTGKSIREELGILLREVIRDPELNRKETLFKMAEQQLPIL